MRVVFFSGNAFLVESVSCLTEFTRTELCRQLSCFCRQLSCFSILQHSWAVQSPHRSNNPDRQTDPTHHSSDLSKSAYPSLGWEMGWAAASAIGILLQQTADHWCQGWHRNHVNAEEDLQMADNIICMWIADVLQGFTYLRQVVCIQTCALWLPCRHVDGNSGTWYLVSC